MESKCPDETSRMRGMYMNLCILRRFEDTFPLCAAQVKWRNRGWGGVKNYEEGHMMAQAHQRVSHRCVPSQLL